MKKSFLLLGLLTTTICLTACWSKNFNMSFEEALQTANHSILQDILSENENFEQSFEISGSYDSEWSNIDANLSSDSKQNISNNNSESSTNFDVNIKSKNNDKTKITWTLDLKLVNDTIYLNISSLDLTWNDNLAMVGMAVEWIKGQWLSIPMTWLSDVPNTLSYFKNTKELNSKITEIIINEWSVVYSWKFSQFNWYNARKISLNNDKLNELIKEYYNTSNTTENNEENSGDINNEIPQINIENFEWYIVITWKDKVTTVIENMDMVDNDLIMNANWFAWKNYEINISEGNEQLITITAKKNFSKYKVSATIANNLYLDWTISPKASKSWISLTFNATLTIKNESESNNITVPFKGSWKYNPIKDFSISVPENSQDLSELLWAYLWTMMWWDEYTGDYTDNYYDNIYDENDLILDNTEVNSQTDELESLESNESITTTE